MKYSTMGLRGTPGKLHGNPEPKVPRPPFVHPRSVPILPTDMTHSRHRSDSVNMTNSSLYQLVTKRKLSPEFAMMSHSVAGEDLSHWQSKRARKEVATFESSITAQEKLSPARDSRSYPYFASEREGLTAPRRYDLNPPPLEPIVVRKEVNRAVLSNEERSLLEKPSIDIQSLFPNPNEKIFPPEFGRNTAPNEVSHFRARMVYDKYVSAGRSFPEESLVPGGKDLYTSYYHSYQQQGSKGHPKAKLDGLMVSSDSRRTSMDGHSGEETSRSAFHPGYPFDGSYNGLDGSSIMRDYQGYRHKNPDELRKYTERDKFHEAVDAILRFRRQQGLQMTEGYLRRLPYPPGQNYQAPVQSKQDEVPNLTSNRRFVPRPQRQHQLTHTNPPLSGGPYENGSHPWSKITEDSAGKTIKHLTRNDENRNLVKGSSARKDTSAIISLAIKRIGRGRFGVLECLNNFAHQLHSVEKQWKACRPNGAEFKTDGRKHAEDLRPLEADVSNLNDYTNLVNHTTDSVNNDAPLDLTTANGLKEDESSRGSFMEAGVAESARLPIKKRTAKYRSLSDDDVVKQHTNESDIADISSTTSELPPVKMEVTAHESAPADESGSTASASCDVKLEKRLRTLIETPDEEGNLPLHLAVMKNDLDVTSALVREMNLRNMSLDRYNRQKKTPLHLAIKRQNVGIVMALLGGSSSCNIPDADGNTAIHLSVETEEIFDIFRTICLHTSVPIDVSAVNRDGLNILDLIERKRLPGEYLNLLMSSQLIDRSSDGKKIVAHVTGVKRCSPEAAEKALLGTETTSVYSEHYHMRQQQEFVRQNSDCRSAAEASMPATVAVDALPANLSPSLLYYSTSSPSAVISLPPVLSPCRPTSPLSPSSSSSSSQLSSLSSFSASSSSPSLSISYRSPLPLSRSCLPLPSSSPTSSASLSLSPPSYGANAMSLYAVC